MKFYEKEEMVDASFDYCQRASQISSLDLANETLALEFYATDIQSLITENTEKLLGIWGTDPSDGKQSIYLIPVDSSGKAILKDGKLQGAETWGGRPPLNSILGTDDVTMRINIEAFYSTLE